VQVFVGAIRNVGQSLVRLSYNAMTGRELVTSYPVGYLKAYKLNFVPFPWKSRRKIFKFRLKSRAVRLATISCFCSLPQSPPCKHDKLNRTLWNPQFEISALPGFTERMVVMPCPCFGWTGWSHPQRSGNSRFLDSWISWPLKMGSIGYPETSVRNYHHTLCKTQEECKSHLLHGGSLNSRKPKGSLCAR
jgi:hypothetical protein